MTSDWITVVVVVVVVFVVVVVVVVSLSLSLSLSLPLSLSLGRGNAGSALLAKQMQGGGDFSLFGEAEREFLLEVVEMTTVWGIRLPWFSSSGFENFVAI